LHTLLPVGTFPAGHVAAGVSELPVAFGPTQLVPDTGAPQELLVA